MKLKKNDTKKMYEIYDKWPEFSKKAYESQHEDSSLDPSNHIVFAGIGGSGAIGDIFSSILSKTNTHVSVVKGYHLPKTVDSKTLVITTSVSGNSAETLSCLNLAKKNNNKIIAFSSGGKMRKICEKNKIQHVEIPQLHSPRASFTVYLYTMLKVLKKTIPIDKKVQAAITKGFMYVYQGIFSLFFKFMAAMLNENAAEKPTYPKNNSNK